MAEHHISHEPSDDISDFTFERTPISIESDKDATLLTFMVDEEDAKTRLDAFFALAIKGFSRTRFKELIKAGEVNVNGEKEETPNRRLKTGDQVLLRIPPPEDPIPKGEDIPLTIVYEDEDLIVVDKPANLVVHPAAGNWTGTLVNALIHHCGDTLSGIGGVRRPGIVHRLDKETSGLLVVAKNDQAHKHLTAQFADHGRTGPLRRAYKALVWNEPPRGKGTIETQIGRSNNNRLKMAVVKDGGREAITHYDIIEAYGREDNGGTALASLVTCHLETGRTHQIRVHMGHVECPLVGDPVYGTGFQTKIARLSEPASTRTKSFKRQALHAYLLSFAHPRTSETMHFESDLPDDMERLVEAFRKI